MPAPSAGLKRGEISTATKLARLFYATRQLESYCDGEHYLGNGLHRRQCLKEHPDTFETSADEV